jgi:hypothetical protein
VFNIFLTQFTINRRGTILKDKIIIKIFNKKPSCRSFDTLIKIYLLYNDLANYDQKVRKNNKKTNRYNRIIIKEMEEIDVRNSRDY